jgi:Na+-translocating ferredoxin:NAD+ oxidoreductase RnfG subunit
MKIALSIVTFFIITYFVGFDKIEERIKKEVLTTFEIETYTKKGIQVSNAINETLPLKITDENFFEISNNNQLIGYYYLGKAFGKADYFDFIVIFNKDLIVSKVSVLVYRENHGGEVASKRWLKQFNGIPTSKTLEYQKDIVGISGATISVKSMTSEVNKLLKTVAVLADKNQL